MNANSPDIDPQPHLAAKPAPESQLAAKPGAETELRRARDLFIQRWGQMSNAWGISRTMAEVHALLYLSEQPLSTDDIMEQLQISRGNASMTIRSLVDWGLIQRIHRRGDRKEYFATQTDVWQMFENISRQRKRREIEPVVETIHTCRQMLDRKALGKAADSPAVRTTRQRMEEMLEFLEAINGLYEKFLVGGPSGLRRILMWLLKTI